MGAYRQGFTCTAIFRLCVCPNNSETFYIYIHSDGFNTPGNIFVQFILLYEEFNYSYFGMNNLPIQICVQKQNAFVVYIVYVNRFCFHFFHCFINVFGFLYL